ncbi:cation diffusion facilitator family transporter [Poriferisphaera sp. WC338]|uniref:cation diffusion facilitator family transporter n=1 Tax=Poriferisphaera sp. WC338 TaxID=3425129 RepID=UPI003D818FC4
MPHDHNTLIRDPETLKVASRALIIGMIITCFKFGVFFLTNSVAVLSDALESIINVVAAAVMLYSIWYSTRPPDETHPYGHGKVEFLAIGFEGWMILFAALTIIWTSIERFFTGITPQRLNLGLGLLFAIGILSAALAVYVIAMGRRLGNDVLLADGKHLATDVISTFAVLLGLILVRATGWYWLDPLIALAVAACILPISWRLLWQSIDGLMDKSDPHDLKRITDTLDHEIELNNIVSYHKVRSRHVGAFHWIDMHLQVIDSLTVAESHALASEIEHRIERLFQKANATAHIEPAITDAPQEPDANAPCPTPGSKTTPNFTSDPENVPSEPLIKQDESESAQPINTEEQTVAEVLDEMNPPTDHESQATSKDNQADQPTDNPPSLDGAYELSDPDIKPTLDPTDDPSSTDTSFKPPRPGA